MMKKNPFFKKIIILAGLLLCIINFSFAHDRYSPKNFTDTIIHSVGPIDSSWFINYLLKKNNAAHRTKFSAVPGYHTAASSYDAVVINSNSDGSNHPDEAIYFKTGKITGDNWYTDPQMIVENFKIRVLTSLAVDVIQSPLTAQKISFKLGESNAGVLDGNKASTALGIGALAQRRAEIGSEGKNSAFGAFALNKNETGGDNTAIGSYALENNKSSYNTAVGHAALKKSTGMGNTAIGSYTGSQLESGNYNIIIGSDVQLPSTTSTRGLNIGNIIFGKNIGIATAVSRSVIGICANDPLAKLDIQGGNDANGIGGDVNAAMAFQHYDGGYRHWIKTRHSSDNKNGNAIDFFLNNSDTKEGSAAPGLGSKLGMTINSAAVIITSKLQVDTYNLDSKAKLDIQGGQLENGKNGTKEFPTGLGGDVRAAVALQRYDGGYRHWIQTLHTGKVNSPRNSIGFYLNNSTSPDGSSGPVLGSTLGMEINSIVVKIPNRLGIGNPSPTMALEVGQDDATTTRTLVQVHGSAVFNNNFDLNKTTQVSINTSARPDSFALVVGGTTFIGDWATAENSGDIINKIYRKKASLWVQGGIVSESFLTTPMTTWKDEVFKEGYQLPSIPEVELFINKNKHLPGIPSEEEVKAHGYSLNELDLGLLEKIEHLTLYAIEQDKKATLLDMRIIDLQKKLAKANNQKQELELLKNEIRQIKKNNNTMYNN